MRRYYYEKARSMQRHWLIFDRERGTPLPGLTEASKAVAVCFSQDDAERIVEALNCTDDGDDEG